MGGKGGRRCGDNRVVKVDMTTHKYTDRQTDATQADQQMYRQKEHDTTDSQVRT